MNPLRQPSVSGYSSATGDVSSSPELPHWLWDTPSRLSFPKGQSGRRVQLTICLHIMLMLRTRGAVLLSPPIRLHGLHRNNAICILNIPNSLVLTDTT